MGLTRPARRVARGRGRTHTRGRSGDDGWVWFVFFSCTGGARGGSGYLGRPRAGGGDGWAGLGQAGERVRSNAAYA